MKRVASKRPDNPGGDVKGDQKPVMKSNVRQVLTAQKSAKPERRVTKTPQRNVEFIPDEDNEIELE
jgi:hypothetical protein